MEFTNKPGAVNTPTLLEEYEGDKAGFDQAVEGSHVIELSREYDRVDGNEELYKVLLNNLKKPDYPIDGNEGFFETIKAGAAKFVQMIKDFFKWLFSFFTSKAEVSKRKTDNLLLNLDNLGVRKDQIDYPPQVKFFYNGNGYPPISLGWVPGAIKETEGLITKVNEYVKVVEKACNDFGHLKDYSEGTLKDFKSTLQASELRTLGVSKVNEESKFYGASKVLVRPNGEIVITDPSLVPKVTQFKTDLSEVRKLGHEHLELVKKAGDMIEDTTRLEKVFIKNFLSTLDEGHSLKDKEGFAQAVETLRGLIRVATSNIGRLTHRIFDNLNGSYRVLNTSLVK